MRFLVVLLWHRWKNKVRLIVRVYLINRILSIKMELEDAVINIIVVYLFKSGIKLKSKGDFLNELDRVIIKLSK